MGLTTRASSPPPYSHSNGLVEDVIGRIRPLAGGLMHLSEQVGVDFSSNSPWWSWAVLCCFTHNPCMAMLVMLLFWSCFVYRHTQYGDDSM